MIFLAIPVVSHLLFFRAEHFKNVEFKVPADS